MEDPNTLEKRRSEFLESAYSLFSQRGIASVTLQEVADTAGYGVATLYRYFSNKPGLAIEVGAWKWRAFLEHNQERLRHPDFEGMTGVEIFAFYLDSFLELYRDHRDLLRFNQFFNIYVRSADVPAESMRPYQEVIDLVAACFHITYERARQDHTLRTDTSEAEMFSTTVHLMMAAVTRYAVGLVYQPPGAFDAERELLLLRDMLLREYALPMER